jgi:signal peptide peptidase SppA
MKSYSHIIGAMTSTCWAVAPEKVAEIGGFMAAIANGASLPEKVWDSERERSAAAGQVTFLSMAGVDITAAVQGGGAQTAQTVAVIQVFGTISHRANLLSEFSGGTSIEGLKRSFRQARAQNPKAIVFEHDSPGGSVKAVEEFADELYQATQDGVKIIHVCNTLMASADYHIAAGSGGEIVCTPSGEVGSIGVYMLHMDYSGSLAEEGIVPTFVYAGEKKVQGNAYEALSDEARADLQAHVDRYYDSFTKSVARGRKVTQAVVKATFGKGDVVGAADAKKLGMIDRVDTMEGTLRRLGVTSPTTAARAEDALPGVQAEGGTIMLAKDGDDVVLVGEWPRRCRISQSAIDGVVIELAGGEIHITAKNARATFSTSGPGEDDNVHRCSCLTASYVAVEEPEPEPEPTADPAIEVEPEGEPEQPAAPSAAFENERRLRALQLAAL